MTRDEEIEAFAIASTASWLERVTPLEGLPSDDQIDEHFEEAIASADIAWEALDRWRSSRAASAPEKTTPTDLAALLAMMESYFASPQAFAWTAVHGIVERAYKALKAQQAQEGSA